MRVAEEGAFAWGVMENVAGFLNHPAVPKSWHPARLRDWDCGGETSRKRAFWTWPLMVLDPVPRPGEPAYSVMASTAKRGAGQYATDKRFLAGDLPIEEYERLQGVPGITAELRKRGAARGLLVHLLGNGAALSTLIAPASLAAASGLAFLFSELADLVVYTPLRRRNLVAAVLASSVVGAVVDSVIFLTVAFGSLAYLPGQVIGKCWALTAALLVLMAWRGRTA